MMRLNITKWLVITVFSMIACYYIYLSMHALMLSYDHYFYNNLLFYINIHFKHAVISNGGLCLVNYVYGYDCCEWQATIR